MKIKLSYIAVISAILCTPNLLLADISFDGSLGPQKQLFGPDFMIEAADGRLIADTTLFHSFQTFSIENGESATFKGPDSINRILSRVTGGEISSIDGAIRATMPAVDLYLLNPAGLLFGPNASLEINGSFHASTADYLRMGENGLFLANPAQESVLVVDPPSAFGFLSENPASINIEQSTLIVPAGSTLSLTGGAINIEDALNSWSAYLSASGGRIDLVSVASAGEAILLSGDAGPDIDVASFQSFGEITMQHGWVDAGGNGGGTVIIRAGKLALDSSYIYASAKGPVVEGKLGAGVDIKISGDVILDNVSAIGTNVFHGVTSDSGGVNISAENISFLNESWIQSVAYGEWNGNAASIGNSGGVTITSESLLLDGLCGISARTGGQGDGGDIAISADTIMVKNGSQITNGIFGGSGDSGNITVNADNVLLTNPEHPERVTGFFAQTYWPGTGKGGDIAINAQNLTLFSGTELSTAARYTGQAGNIKLNISDSLLIEGAKEKSMYAGIFSNTFWSADGGNCTINANSLKLSNNAAIMARTFSTGDAGDAKISVSQLQVTDSSFISVSGYSGSGGDSGSIIIAADDILISGPSSSESPFGIDFTGISTSASPSGGRGGDIQISTDSLQLTDRGSITATSWGPGQSGNIDITAQSLEVNRGANLNNSAYGSGDAGSIIINADQLEVSGVHPEIYTEFNGKANMARSSIFSQTHENGGQGGQISVATNKLLVTDSGTLATDTYGSGQAGNITINAENVLISGTNSNLYRFIANNDFNNNFAGASISSNSYALLLGTESTGNGGEIKIASNSLKLDYGGYISSVTETAGHGGDIHITSNSTMLSKNAFISSQSTAAGDAGNISLLAKDLFSMRDSTISTAALSADGGNIKIDNRDLVHLVNSEITASVDGGANTTGGNIDIDPQAVILNNSKVVANAHEGKGGNIDIVTNILLSDQGSSIDASSALGIDGSVDIQAPITSVSGSIAPLPEEVSSAITMLREPCMARIQEGEYSSFVIEGRDNLPPTPAAPLPSPLLLN